MTFGAFKMGVARLLTKAGDDSRVWYERDLDKGFFKARTESGVKIIMPISGQSLTVRWGSGHQAMVSADILSA